MLIGSLGSSIIVMPKEINGEIESVFPLDKDLNQFHIYGIRNFCNRYKDFKVSKSVFKDEMSFNYALELVSQGCIVIEMTTGGYCYTSFYVPKDVLKITPDQINWLKKNKKDLANIFKEKYSLIKVDETGDYDGVDTFSSSVEERTKILKDYFSNYKFYKDNDIDLKKGENKNVGKEI